MVLYLSFRTNFNIMDLCGILTYKRMYPHKCGIKTNYTERPIIIAISSYKVNIEALKLYKGQRNFIHRASMYMSISNTLGKIVSEYDQEIPQSPTADNPVAPRGRAAQPS